MKNLKIGIFCLTAILFSIQTKGQHWCATDEMNNKALIDNPESQAQRNALERFTEQYVKNEAAHKSAMVTKVIPIVFHILHQGGAENISDAQIIDAVNIINIDYQKQNADTAIVVPSFTNNIANVQFEFRLATIDPNGNCTNGIIRHYDAKTNWDRSAQNNNGYSNYVYTWNPTKYLNVYVVKSITGNAAAYTYVPGTWPTGSSRDAIVALYDYVGSIGASSVNNSRTLTHEIGHWFNLQHLWGNTNQPGVACGDDLVGDTPETMGSNLVCNLNLSYCNPPVIENVQNYMDYSYCSCMFTNGQSTRMNAAANSSTNGRNNLWTTANLTATGTTGAPPPTCAPIPSFYPEKRFICAGSSLNFTSWTYNGPVTSYSWSFPGGTPSTDNTPNPVITYNTPGIYNVTLTVANATGSNSVTYNNIVKVVPAQGITTVPNSESFETITFPGTDWDSTNTGGAGWAISTAAAYTGSKSIRLSNYSGNVVGFDEFITPAYSFSGVTNPTVTFKLAFANKVTSSTDNLKVYASVDCGKTWTLRYNKSGTALATAGVVTAAFTPTTLTQWRQETVPAMGTFSNQPNVRLMFSYNYTGDGNNIYIDDINVNGTVGIDDLEAGIQNLMLQPNPAKGETNLHFILSKNSVASITICDVAGRVADKRNLNSLPAGEYNYRIGQNLNPGIYFVQLTIDNKELVQKLVIE